MDIENASKDALASAISFFIKKYHLDYFFYNSHCNIFFDAAPLGGSRLRGRIGIS